MKGDEMNRFWLWRALRRRLGARTFVKWHPADGSGVDRLHAVAVLNDAASDHAAARLIEDGWIEEGRKERHLS